MYTGDRWIKYNFDEINTHATPHTYKYKFIQMFCEQHSRHALLYIRTVLHVYTYKHTCTLKYNISPVPLLLLAGQNYHKWKCYHGNVHQIGFSIIYNVWRKVLLCVSKTIYCSIAADRRTDIVWGGWTNVSWRLYYINFNIKYHYNRLFDKVIHLAWQLFFLILSIQAQ